MKNTYLELIEQTFNFPQDEFELKNGNLLFHQIDLAEIIKEYGTPLRLTYLPKISQQIQKAKQYFEQAMQKHNYTAKYQYCYCTKSSHFRHVLEEALKNDIHIEISSAFDIDMLKRLDALGKIKPKTKIICNGFKPVNYLENIVQIINNGNQYVTPVLDNYEELDYYKNNITTESCNIGLRVATEEEPNFQFYTSRLGIRYSSVLNFYFQKIKPLKQFKLRMLHFFVDTGIRDSIYYWNEFKKCIKLYCELKKLCPSLKAINIGGGLPIKNSLGFNYDYQYMIEEIVSMIKTACDEEQIDYPEIYSEFGSFTVGESGAHIFSVIGLKRQNDSELWYMIDNSLMTTLPDTWGIDQRFILLPINKWKNEYTRVNIGGITCDNSDYYNSEAHISQLYLPFVEKNEVEPLYLGFFNTGAYQENISGYGGIKHCLIPSPKHILITKDKDGKFQHSLHNEEQSADNILNILGY